MTFYSLSPSIIAIITPFAVLFSRSSWQTASTLLLGAILCRGRRTVTGILRTIGLSQDRGFSKYHRILNSLDWSAKRGSSILLKILLKIIGKERPVILIDETLERRKGKKIRAKGYYRDAVRSSRSKTVNTTGLKWMVMALSFRFNFARRAFALPFFTVLEPSEKSTKNQGKRHKTSVDWSIQMVMQLVRWAPAIPFILVGDGGFACAKLAWACFKYNIALVSRLKMNARIYALPEEVPPGKRGRKPKKGVRLISFKEMLKMEDLPWKEVEIAGYDGKKKRVKYLTNTSMWGADSFCPIAIRWVLVKDPTGEMDPLPLMSTDVNLTAVRMIELYVDRWGLEVTFQEARELLGVETQKQWSDKAIARTTPILMALYTIVCLIGHRLNEEAPIIVEKAAWYDKGTLTFSDLLKAVRVMVWKDNLFFRKEFSDPSVKIQLENDELKESLRDLLAQMLSQAA
jgi:DDE superfamily endonuclease